MQTDLSGKVALVTGGSLGIGRAIALTLAKSKAQVVVNARRPGPAQAVIDEIEQLGGRAYFESADINDYSQVSDMVERVLKRLGQIDILVANGGSHDPPARFFRDTDPALYGKYALTRWFCRLYCIRAVLDPMIERKQGKIIVISTDAGRVPTPAESVIGGMAAGMVMMTKVLGREFSRWGIRINTICITMTADTPSYEGALHFETAHIFRKVIERMPFGVNKPQDIAEAALFLASPESDQITGQILSINGGLSFPG